MQLREALPSRLTKRVCLSCGYRGRALQGDRGETVYQCPHCAADLYARPARSYAEMEGLSETDQPVGMPQRLVVPLEPSAPVERRRWLGRVEWVCKYCLGAALVYLVVATAMGG